MTCCVYWGPVHAFGYIDKIDAWTECCCTRPKIQSCVTTPSLWTTRLSLDAARTTTCATEIWKPFYTSTTIQVKKHQQLQRETNSASLLFVTVLSFFNCSFSCGGGFFYSFSFGCSSFKSSRFVDSVCCQVKVKYELSLVFLFLLTNFNMILFYEQLTKARSCYYDFFE